MLEKILFAGNTLNKLGSGYDGQPLLDILPSRVRLLAEHLHILVCQRLVFEGEQQVSSGGIGGTVALCDVRPVDNMGVAVFVDDDVARVEIPVAHLVVLGHTLQTGVQFIADGSIYAIVHKHLEDQQLCALALIENIQREDLNPIETALGYRNLMQKFFIKQVDLAQYCGKSKASISNTLRLLELEPEVQQALQDGTLTEGHARALLMLPADRFRIEVFKRMLNKKLTVRQAEQLVARLLDEPRRLAEERKNSPDKTDVWAFEQELQEALGTKVEVRCGRNRQKGTLVIHYHSLAELDNIASRLKHKML